MNVRTICLRCYIEGIYVPIKSIMVYFNRDKFAQATITILAPDVVVDKMWANAFVQVTYIDDEKVERLLFQGLCTFMRIYETNNLMDVDVISVWNSLFFNTTFDYVVPRKYGLKIVDEGPPVVYCGNESVVTPDFSSTTNFRASDRYFYINLEGMEDENDKIDENDIGAYKLEYIIKRTPFAERFAFNLFELLAYENFILTRAYIERFNLLRKSKKRAKRMREELDWLKVIEPPKEEEKKEEEKKEKPGAGGKPLIFSLKEDLKRESTFDLFDPFVDDFDDEFERSNVHMLDVEIFLQVLYYFTDRHGINQSDVDNFMDDLISIFYDGYPDSIIYGKKNRQRISTIAAIIIFFYLYYNDIEKFNFSLYNEGLAGCYSDQDPTTFSYRISYTLKPPDYDTFEHINPFNPYTPSHLIMLFFILYFFCCVTFSSTFIYDVNPLLTIAISLHETRLGNLFIGDHYKKMYSPCAMEQKFSTWRAGWNGVNVLVNRRRNRHYTEDMKTVYDLSGLCRSETNFNKKYRHSYQGITSVVESGRFYIGKVKKYTEEPEGYDPSGPESKINKLPYATLEGTESTSYEETAHRILWYRYVSGYMYEMLDNFASRFYQIRNTLEKAFPPGYYLFKKRKYFLLGWDLARHLFWLSRSVYYPLPDIYSYESINDILLNIYNK